MIRENNENFSKLKDLISRKRKIIEEMELALKSFDESHKEAIASHITQLKYAFLEQNDKIPDLLDQINLDEESSKKTLIQEKSKPEKEKSKPSKKTKITPFDKQILKRLGNQSHKKSTKKKEKKPSRYAELASKMFSEKTDSLIKKKYFDAPIKDLSRTYMEFVPNVYVSIILFTTLISVFVGLFIFLFLLFFHVSATIPFITFVEDLSSRALSVFWVLFLIPIATFLFMYFYPALERKSLESKINKELPFATIHMSSISGSLIEPTNIFSIIITTGEYPNLKKEFTKVLNEINIYGHDLITALKNSAESCPSDKLAELYNGLSTTITSGGDLTTFFDKRSQTLLLDYKLERERYNKTAETFIDVYISTVIAAPMILMLLFMMIQITGLGAAISPTMISIFMVLGISAVNIIFIIFLHLKQPSQ